MFDMVPFRRRGRGLTEREDPFNQMVDSFFNDALSVFEGGFKTDIKEEEDKFVLEAELPGMTKDDIELEINENILTIKARKEDERREEQKNYIRRERRTGSYQRSFRIKNVNEEEIKARHENGILIVDLPKEEPSRPKRKTIDIE